MKTSFTAFCLVVASLVSAGCSEPSVVGHTREESFYTPFVNSASHYPQAKTELNDLKLLQTDDSFPMRFALFDNGKFYYEIDKLGTGEGDWGYEKGVLQLAATRPVFDMYFYLSAVSDSGTAVQFRFNDRHGLVSLEAQLRDPVQIRKEGGEPAPLKVFKNSDKEI